VNRKMLQKALKTLPPTLDQTYDRILASIGEEYSQYALRILQWLTFSARPLSIDEVAEVVAIDAKRDPAFDPDEVLQNPLDALTICSSLVTITIDSHYGISYYGISYYEMEHSPRQIVALAHFSVKEYLVSDRIRRKKVEKYSIQEDVCHNAIATSCLSYLHQFQQLELSPGFLRLFRLARYSAEYWTYHAQKIEEQSKETDWMVIRLCSKENPAYVNWIRLWDPENQQKSPDFRLDPEILEPLYYAALYY
jgi:hypothetical protein